MRASGVSHIGIAVPDLDAAVRLFSARFGVAPGPVHENDAQGVRLVQLDFGNLLVELLAPSRADGPLASFLARNPKGGLHHMGLATGDLDGSLADMQEAGVRSLGTPSTNVFGRRMAFLNPGDLQGVLVELEQR